MNALVHCETHSGIDPLFHLTSHTQTVRHFKTLITTSFRIQKGFILVDITMILFQIPDNKFYQKYYTHYTFQDISRVIFSCGKSRHVEKNRVCVIAYN